MKNNLSIVPGNPGPEINKITRVNGYSNMKNTLTISNYVENRPVIDPLLLQLREKEKINDGLADLLDQRTQELAEYAEATTKSFSVIGHDLRGPVCTVLAALELLKQKMDSDYSVGSEKFIDIASVSAKRTLDMLDKLLEWAISKNNCITFNPVKINLREFILHELDNEMAPIALKAITMDNAVSPKIMVLGDIHMVSTIFRNLISNAVKFTEYGGKIKVMTSVSGRFVEISVNDNGIGMTSEQRNDIMKNETGKFKLPGSDGKFSGIGLLLCKEFIERHGSKLQIVSKPGKGSRFKFSLERAV